MKMGKFASKVKLYIVRKDRKRQSLSLRTIEKIIGLLKCVVTSIHRPEPVPYLNPFEHRLEILRLHHTPRRSEEKSWHGA